jgi:hypothetical protein
MRYRLAGKAENRIGNTFARSCRLRERIIARLMLVIAGLTRNLLLQKGVEIAAFAAMTIKRAILPLPRLIAIVLTESTFADTLLLNCYKIVKSLAKGFGLCYSSMCISFW